ncbi:MAG TPA: extracellular solute-binding protein [Streptosporangiaceae bacterium]|nr:extracellular solute-binding protein [Streptosporangiaceae bacterium]
MANKCMRLRWIAPGVILGIGSLVLSACSSSSGSTHSSGSSSPIVLQFWNTYNQTDSEASTIAKVIIPAFEKSHPGIKVVSDVYPTTETEMYSKMLAAINAGNPPDIVRADISWVPGLAQEGALVPLSKDMPGFSAVAASVYPGTMAPVNWKGTDYGLPLDTNTQCLYWNKADFKAAGISGPPTTMNDLLADAKKLTNPAKKQWGLGIDGTDLWNLLPYVWSAGGQITSNSLNTASGFLNGPATVGELTTISKLVSTGEVGSDILGGTGVISGEEGFPTGKYAMYIDGPWAVGTFSGGTPALTYNKDYGIAQMPAGAGGSISVVGGEDLIVPSGGKHAAAAEEFVKYMLSATAQQEMAKAGQMSVLKSASVFETKLASYYAPFAEQLGQAEARPPVPNYAKIDAAISNAILAALHGKGTMKAEIDAVTPQVNQLLTGS